MTTHNLVYLPSAENAIRLTPNGLHSGMDITIQNVNESATVYLGGEGVTSTSYGFKLLAGSAFSIELPSTDALYAVSGVDNVYVATLSFSLEG